MVLRCRSCDVEIPRRSYRPGSGRLCGDCREESALAEDRAELRKTIVWVLALAILVLAAAVLGGDLEGLERVWYLHVPVIAAFALLSVFPHELAHALAFRVLGGHAHLIEIGRGPRGRRRRFLGLDWRIRSIASTGVTYGSLLSADRYRLRSWWVSAAGPGSHVLAIGAGVGVMSWTSSVVLAWIARDFVIANGIDLWQNLRPTRWKSEHGEIRSDGAALLEIPRMDAREIQWELACSFDAAHQDYGVGPDAQRALGRLRRLRERDDLESFGPAFLDAGIAWCLLLLGDARGAAEAERRSAAAWEQARAQRLRTEDLEELALAEIFPTFEAIRGCALMETGSLEEGGRMVMNALKRLEDRYLEALFMCFLARGARRHGEHGFAKDLHEAVKRLDRNCPLLARLEDEGRDAEADRAQAQRDLDARELGEEGLALRFGHGVLGEEAAQEAGAQERAEQDVRDDHAEHDDPAH